MLKKLKWIIYTKAFIWFAYYLIRIYSLTFRLTVKNEAPWQALLGEKNVLLCTWHQQFFAAIRYFKTYSRLNPGLMISRSKDGDLISGVANKTGWKTPRGSSSRGGRQALSEMISHMNLYGLGAHILDGPTGPIGIIKPGVIKMVQETRAVIVPFYIKAADAWYFNSWDRFMLPKPFSKVELVYKMPIEFQPAADSSEFEAQRKNLEKIMLPELVFK